MTNTLEVSILMPVKNTAPFLVECLASILQQTFKDWELIVVDDNSTDGSYQILSGYAKQEARIKLLKNEQQGIIAALQLAYRHSIGQFITRMDSDDIMELDKLELMLNQLQLKGSGHIAVGLVNYFSDAKLGEGYLNYAQWLNKLTTSETNFTDIYKECSIPSPCWMISRTDFDSCGGFNSEVYPEDYDLAFRFRKAGLKIAAVKKVIHQWRDYETRTSRTEANYADNRFAELKIMHFLEQDYNSTLLLILWGAGKKGKKLAQLLTDKGVTFKWVTNNTNKIGKDIYGIILQDMQSLTSLEKARVIVALSSPKDSNDIAKVKNNNLNHQYFQFH